MEVPGIQKRCRRRPFLRGPPHFFLSCKLNFLGQSTTKCPRQAGKRKWLEGHFRPPPTLRGRTTPSRQAGRFKPLPWHVDAGGGVGFQASQEKRRPFKLRGSLAAASSAGDRATRASRLEKSKAGQSSVSLSPHDRH